MRLIQINITGLLGAYDVCGEILLVLRFERQVDAWLSLMEYDVNASKHSNLHLPWHFPGP